MCPVELINSQLRMYPPKAIRLSLNFKRSQAAGVVYALLIHAQSKQMYLKGQASLVASTVVSKQQLF